MAHQKIVVVFGTFDGLHDGHRHFLREAKKLGDRLVAVVARDIYIRDFKGREPRFSLQERIDALKAEGFADGAIPGDAVQNSWEVLERVRPQIIALGYDQTALHEALQKKQFDPPIEIVKMLALEPDALHSSILFK